MSKGSPVLRVAPSALFALGSARRSAHGEAKRAGGAEVSARVAASVALRGGIQVFPADIEGAAPAAAPPSEKNGGAEK